MNLREAIEDALSDYDVRKLVINKSGNYKGRDVVHILVTVGKWKHELEIVKELGMDSEQIANIVKSYIKVNLEGPKE